jgi:hypothetical protein
MAVCLALAWCVVVGFFVAVCAGGFCDFEQAIIFLVWSTCCVGVLIKSVPANRGFDGRCPTCRYDLAGLSPDATLCPECGVVFKRTAVFKPSDITLRWYRVRRMVLPCVFFAAVLFQGKSLLLPVIAAQYLARGYSWSDSWLEADWALREAIPYGTFLLPVVMAFSPIAVYIRQRKWQAVALGVLLCGTLAYLGWNGFHIPVGYRE